MHAITVRCLIFTLLALTKVGEIIGQRATIETLVILDKELSEEFQYDLSAKVKYCDLFHQVQEIYDTLRKTWITVTFKLNGLKLMSEADEQSIFGNITRVVCNETVLAVREDSLNPFIDFVQKQEWRNEYDIIILLTNKTIKGYGYNGEITAAGFARADGSCSKEKVGIVRPSPIPIAHEIGHLIGAPDDLRTERWPCYRGNIYSYIMSPLGPLQTKTFSRCSISRIRHFIRSREGRCLNVINGKDTVRCKAQNPCPVSWLQGTS